MNKRLQKLIENQPIRGGQFLDCYNQTVSEIAGTITTRVDASNMVFVTEYETDNNQGGANCPTIGTTDLGMPKIVEKMEINEPCIMRQLRTPEGRELRKQGIDTFANKELQPRPDGVSNTLTSVEKDNYVCEPHIKSRPHGYNKGGEKTISPTVKSSAFAENNPVSQNYRIRKLTPRECFRLMGCDEPTIEKLLNAGISNSQLYKLAGNSIVVDVLTAIFDKMFVNAKHSIGDQLTLF